MVKNINFGYAAENERTEAIVPDGNYSIWKQNGNKAWEQTGSKSYGNIEYCV